MSETLDCRLETILQSARFDLVSHAHFHPEPFLTHAHAHEDLFQLSYLVEGYCRVPVAGNDCLLRSGDLLFVPPGSLHGPAVDLRDNRSELMHVKFSVGDDRGDWRWPTVIPVDSRMDYESLFHAMVAEYHMQRPLRETMLRLFLMQLVLILERSACARKAGGDHAGGRLSLAAEQGVRRSMDWIRAHYAEPFQLKDIARAVGMSPSALSHGFRELTGESPMRYLTQYRLSRALLMMERTNTKLDAIAESVGFGSAAYLSRMFVKHFNVPPRKYLAGMRAADNARREP